MALPNLTTVQEFIHWVLGSFLQNALRTAKASTEVVVLAQGAIIANGSQVVNTSEYRVLSFHANVTGAPTGTSPTLNLYIDQSFDGGLSWQQLVELGPNPINTSGDWIGSIGPGCTSNYSMAGDFGDMVRFRWALGGTNPSFNLGIFAVGKS